MKPDNIYINKIHKYVEDNTPLHFMINLPRYNEILEVLSHLDILNSEKEIIVASYALIYTTFNYHLSIKDNPLNKSYYILVGDYISSYVSEIIYKNGLYDLMKIFILNTKKMALNNVNNSYEDALLRDILDYYKGR